MVHGFKGSSYDLKLVKNYLSIICKNAIFLMS